MAEVLTPMRRQILEFIITCQRERNFPPTIREIGDHVGLKSPATVANHIEVLKNAGYIEKNPQQPRTLTVRLDVENPAPDQHIRYIPFVGDVAAGTGVLAIEHGHELMSIPEQFAGRGDSFVLQVRGDSMIDAGIYDGDYVIIRRGQTANSGEIVVALVMGEEATLKRLRRKGQSIALEAANPAYETRIFGPDQVQVQGRLVGLIRRYH